jgi:hypothetical protein
MVNERVVHWGNFSTEDHAEVGNTLQLLVDESLRKINARLHSGKNLF